MPVLSLDDINNNFPDNRYMLKVVHNPNLWNKISVPPLPTPIRVKFDDGILTSIPSSIANDKGIYMFFLEPNHPFSPSINHLLYIGRVQAGRSNFSFKKRMYDYKITIGNKTKSLNKVLLTNLWPDHTFVYFYSLNHMTDQDVKNIEKNLYANIVPPLNAQIEGKTEQTRNLY